MAWKPLVRQIAGWLALFILWTWLYSTTSDAITPTGFGTGEDMVVRFWNFFINVVCPVIAVLGIFGIVGAILVGHGIAKKVVGAISILAIVGGGLPWLSDLTGGRIAASATVEEGVYAGDACGNSAGDSQATVDCWGSDSRGGAAVDPAGAVVGTLP